MKITLVGPAQPSHFAGLLGRAADEVPAGLGGTPVNLLGNELLVRGHHVTLVTLSPGITTPQQFDAEGFELICLPWRASARERAKDAFRAERNLIRDAVAGIDTDVVHAHWCYEYALGALASGQRTLVTIHDLPWAVLKLHRNKYRAMRWAMALAVRAKNPQFTAVSPYVSNEWQRTMWSSAPPVVPNITMVPEATCLRRAGSVVTVGDTSRLKNITGALDAFARLVASGFPATLDVVGPGWASTGTAARNWRSSNRHLEHLVTFHGTLPWESTLSLIRTAEVLLHPSVEESFGLSVSEAMAAATPVIGGYRSGAVPWTAGAGALLTDVESPDHMNAALVRLLSDESLRRRLGHNGRDLVRRRFSGPAVTEEFEQIYERTASGSGSATRQHYLRRLRSDE